MSDSEPVSILTDSDSAFLQKSYVLESVEGLLYGIQILLVYQATYALCYRGFKNAVARSILTFVIMIMAICSTIDLATGLIFLRVQIKALGTTPYDPTSAMTNSTIVGIFSSRIKYILGDAIVVWRAWILFERQLAFRLVLVVLLLGSCAATIMNATVDVKQALDPQFERTFGEIILLPLFLLVTNVVATIFIAYKAWLYRKFIRKNLGDSTNKRTKVDQVLVLMIESGLLYCVIWVFDLFGSVHQQDPSNAITFGDISGVIVAYGSGIYPTVIVLLTTSKLTHYDTIIAGPQAQSTIHFASRDGSHSFSSGQQNTPVQSPSVALDDTEGQEKPSEGDKVFGHL